MLRLADPGRQRIHVREAPVRRAVLQHLGIEQTGFLEKVGDERDGLGDHLVEPETVPVPLHHRELGLMPAAGLAAPEHAADSVDVRIPVGQEPLHVGFRRGLQVERVAALEPLGWIIVVAPVHLKRRDNKVLLPRQILNLVCIERIR